MKHMILAITFTLATALAVGSAAADEKSAAGPKPSGTAAAQLDQAKTETKEAAQAVQDYTYKQKSEFVAQMKKDLAGIQEELKKLSARVNKSSGAAKAEAKAKLKALRKNLAQAKKQLNRTGSATESNWDGVKSSIQKSYSELKDSFEKTRQWLSEKIEP